MMTSSNNGLTARFAFVDFAQIVHGQFGFLPPDGGSGTLEILKRGVRQKLGTIRRCLEREGLSYVLVLDEHSVHKRRIFGEYKANRGVSRVPVLDVARLLHEDGAPEAICVGRGHEADDVIATLCARNHDGLSLVISNDRDLWQLMRPRVGIFNPILKRPTTYGDVERGYGAGVRPCHVPLIKALWGDGGDNVPNVMPRSQRSLLGLVTGSDGSLEDFQRLVNGRWDELSETVRLAWMENEDLVARNYSIVKLVEDCEIIWNQEALESP
jgi:5'-3' exonuclease